MSETFVFDEFRAVRDVFDTTLISIRKGCAETQPPADIDWRGAVYDDSPLTTILAGLLALVTHPRAMRTARLLLSDLHATSGFKQKLKLIYQYVAAAHLAKRLASLGCSHLHIHFAHVPATIGMYASLLLDIPFTLVGHANDIFERPTLLHQKAVRAKRFFTISEYNKKHLVAAGLPEQKISVLRCVPSFRAVAPKAVSNGRAVGNPVVIGSLGRLVEKKGMDVLITALATLRSKGYDVRLEIAGDGPLASSLSNQAKALAIDAHVIFLGALAHDAVAAWLGGLDIFALACVQDRHGDVDGIPVSLMEAISQGVPVVSSDLSGIPELIKPNETGILVPPGDADALASGLAQLIDNAAFRGDLVLAAQHWLLEEFGRETNLKRLVSGMGLSEKQ